ncbi:MAG TPA: hypothetical protein VN540_03100 [Clostridia bacterium]|nr:hypothetical protein [Clostridia bacterium]
MDYIPVTEENRVLVNAFLKERWLSLNMVLRGQIVDMTKVDGVVAVEGGKIAGLATYLVSGDTMEITSLDSLVEKKGIGGTLLGLAVSAARGPYPPVEFHTLPRIFHLKGYLVWLSQSLEKAARASPRLPIV